MTGGRVWRILRSSAAAGFVLALSAAGAAFWFAPDRLSGAWRALRGDLPSPPGEVARFEALQEQARQFEEGRVLREAELRRRELAARSMLARAETERRAAERARAEAQALAAPAGASPAERAFEANLELLSRVDPATAKALLATWDDATVARTLRALRPARAAGIVEALASDAAWKDRLPRVLSP